jgi:putative tricarboxylic transport membrane protein
MNLQKVIASPSKNSWSFNNIFKPAEVTTEIKWRKRLIEKWDRVAGYILLIIGAITAWSAIHLSMGRWKHPGPGFLPFGLALLLILFSLILIFSSRPKKGITPAAFWPHRAWLRPLLGVAILIFFALVVEWVGFLITTFVFLVIWMGVIERVRWLTILSVSIGTTAALYLIFALFLDVPLPLGFLKW